jgi:SAM-dependent methyltransferase
MSTHVFDSNYWENRWKNNQTGWDIGHVSTPIKEYFDQVEDKTLRILIPGCGNAWEGEYLYSIGFKNVFLLVIAPSAIEHIKQRITTFPHEQILLDDFFKLDDQFDIIVEQTFFCALDPTMRQAYVENAYRLLKENGRLVGLLFDTDFGNDHPPFGGSKKEYEGYFGAMFNFKHFERSKNSIKPRMGRELFINLEKA